MAERTAVWRIVANFADARRQAKQLADSLDDIDKSQHKLNTTNQAATRVDDQRQRTVAELVSKTRSLADLQKKSAEGSTRAAASLRILANEEEKVYRARVRLQSATLAAQRADSGLQEARNRLAAITKAQANQEVDLTRAHLGVEQAALRVRASELALEQSRNRLAALSKSQQTSELTLARARITVEQASIRVRAAEAGLEQARNRVANVGKNQATLEGELARAHNGVEQALLRLETANFNVARATRTLADEQKKVAAGSGGILNNLKSLTKEFDGVGQSARRFVSFLRLLKLPAIIVGVLGLASALSALVGGLAAVVSALGPVVGLLGALPGLLAAAAGAAGVAVLGFLGVGNALKAYAKEQKATAKTGNSAAKTEISNARRIRDAQRSLRDARQAQARAARNAAENIGTAERRIVDSQRESVQAQRELSQAREEARKNIRDLQGQLEDLALSEERAGLSLEEARANLIRTLNDPESSDLERRSAELAVREAEARLKEIRSQSVDASKELNDAQRKGVEGSNEVVAAKLREADAQRTVVEAQKDLGQTIIDSSEAQRDAAEGVQKAIENLADAQEDAAGSAGSGAAASQEFADAMKKLTPEGRAFVKQLLSMQPLLDKLRATAERGILPGVTAALRSSVSLFPIFNKGVEETGKALGDTAKAGGELISSGPFRRDFATIFKENADLTRIFGRVTLNLADALRNLTISAIPLVRFLAQVTEGWSQTIRVQAEAGRESGRTAAFFEKTRITLVKLGQIFGNLIRGVVGFGRAAFDTGQSFLDTFVTASDKFANFTNSADGQNKIKKYFDDIRPALQEIGKLVGAVAAGFIHLGQDPSTGEFVKQIREKILPAFAELAKNVQGDFGTALVDLFTSLVGVLSKLSEAGGGLVTFVTIFNGFLKVIITILDTVPGATTAIGFFLAAMGGFRALKLASQVTGLSALTKQITKLGAATAGENASGIAKFTAGLKRLGPAVKTAAIAVGAGFVKLLGVVKKAFLALRALLLTNPWILLIAALIVIVVLVVKYWDQIKAAVSAAISFIVDFVKKHWPLLISILLGPLGIIIVQVIKHWSAIKEFITNAVKAIIGFLKKNWQILLAIIISPFAAIILAVSKFWSTIKDFFGSVVSKLIAGFKTIWGGIKEIFVKPFTDAYTLIKKGFTDFGSAFKTAVGALASGLGAVWNKIKGVFTAPVEFLINTVIDDWILGAVNKVLGFLHLPLVPLVPKINQPATTPSGGGGGNAHPLARNTGGPIPGTGNRDTVPAMLTPGEFVLRKSAVRALGPDQVRMLNATGRVGFTGGGPVVPRNSTPITGAASPYVGADNVSSNIVTDIAGNVVDLVRKGAAKGLDLLLKPVRAGLGVLDKFGAPGSMAAGLGNHIIDNLVKFVAGEEEAVFHSEVGDLDLSGGVQRWAPLVGQVLGLLHQPTTLVPAVLELIRHESGGNPNAINRTDINAQRGDPSRGLMQTIGSTFNAYAGPYQSRGIYDPLANIYAGLNYGIHRYGSVMFIPGIYSLSKGGKYRPYATGGPVPGSGSKDTVPAMLTPGEFVIRKAAAKRIGMHNLHALNQAGTQYFHDGGPVRGVVRKQSKGSWVNSLFLNTGSATNFPGAWDNILDARLTKAYPTVPGPGTASDARTLATYLNSTRVPGGGNIMSALAATKWTMSRMLATLTTAQRYISDSVPYARRRKIYGDYGLWSNRSKFWNSDLDRVLGMPQDGKFGQDNVAPLKHVLDHAFGRPHDKFATRPWGPLDAAELAEQEQLRGNALQQEYNGYLSMFASWGLNDLVEKLYAMGPADGMEIARAASKNRNQATALNAAYAKANQLNNPNALDALKMVGYISSWNGQPGLRDLARKLEVPDYAVLQLFESVKDQVSKAVPADKLTRLLSDINLFRQGLFYAHGGGQVPGTGSGDTVPAMLTPGEFVLKKSAVRALGMGNVMALNKFADGGPVGLGMHGPSIPKLASNLVGVGATKGMYVEHADEVNYSYTMNTTINNPVGENSVASMNRNLKRQASLGVLRPGQAE